LIRSADEADAWRLHIAGVDEIYFTVEDLLHRPAWHAQAACRGQGAQTWFPELGRSAEPAKAVCGACPVRTECLEAGLEESEGIWGGLSPRPRRRLAREGAYSSGPSRASSS
jgi:WhiB family redox-sensing transcriptional regulator